MKEDFRVNIRICVKRKDINDAIKIIQEVFSVPTFDVEDIAIFHEEEDSEG